MALIVASKHVDRRQAACVVHKKGDYIVLK